jgi:hypothetical protein
MSPSHQRHTTQGKTVRSFLAGFLAFSLLSSSVITVMQISSSGLLSSPSSVMRKNEAFAQPDNSTNATNCTSPTSGMISWWTGDGNAKDLFRHNPGFVEGGVSFANARVEQGFSFDGNDDRVKISDSTSLNPAGQLTIEAWIRPNFDPDTPNREQSIVSKFNHFFSNGDDSYYLGLNSLRSLRWQVDTGISTVKDNILDISLPTNIAGTFHHIAATYDGITMKVYLDGTLVGQKPATGPIHETTTNTFIGATLSSGNLARPFGGAIDEVGMYSRSLSEDEIASIFNAGSKGKCKDIVFIPGGRPTPRENITINTSTDIKHVEPGLPQARVAFKLNGTNVNILNVSGTIQGPLPSHSLIGIFHFIPENSSRSTWYGEFISKPGVKDGFYEVRLSARDNTGFRLLQLPISNIKIDSTPPVLKIPHDITARATDETGTNINFRTSAKDKFDKNIMPICRPHSGSTFPIGVSTVICSVADKTGNSAVGRFNVTVNGNVNIPNLSLKKDVYDLGDTAFVNGTAPESSRVSVRLLDVDKKIYFDADLRPSENGTILFPIKIDQDAKPGNWLLELTANNSTKHLPFKVKGKLSVLNASVPLQTLQGEAKLQNGSQTGQVLSFKNTGNVSIASILLKSNQGGIIDPSAPGWKSDTLGNGSVVMSALQPLQPGESVNIVTKLNTSLSANINSLITTQHHSLGPLLILPIPDNRIIRGGIDSEFITFAVNFAGDGEGKIAFLIPPPYQECSSNSNSQCFKEFKPNDFVVSTAPGEVPPENIAVAAIPSAGSFFERWDCSDSRIGNTSPGNIAGYVDVDTTCTVKFRAGHIMHINIVGNGIGAVFSERDEIKCGTGGTGNCASGTLSPTSNIRLSALPASESIFSGWEGTGCSGTSATIQVNLDSDKWCTANFRPAANIIPPVRSPLVDPEIIRISYLLATRQGKDIGWPVSEDNSPNQDSHFQLFAAGNSPYMNSAQMYTSASGLRCLSVAYTRPTSPDWYDVFWALDSGPGKIRHWSLGPSGPDNRLLGPFDIIVPNRDSKNWITSYHPFQSSSGEPKSPPFPPGRSTPPEWFTRCMARNGVITADIPKSTQPSITDAFPVCGSVSTTWHNALLGNGPPSWMGLNPKQRLIPAFGGIFGSVNLAVPGPPWVPTHATGVISNSYLSHHDASPNHGEWPGPNPFTGYKGYWLGLYPGVFLSEGDNCRTLSDVGWLLCNDLVMDINPDAQYKYLLTPQQGEWLVTEIEQWLIPNGYRPEPGDRTHAVGRWIADCGEPDLHTELHPLEFVLSSYLQTGALDKEHPNIPSGPPFTQPNLDFSHGSTWNMPLVASEWQNLTGGQPATVNKIVVTGDWQGGYLSFDLWPPAKTTPIGTLHWIRDTDLGLEVPGQESLSLTVTPIPTNNPNHIHITIPEVPYRINQEVCGSGVINGEICANINDRLVDAFLLWWS